MRFRSKIFAVLTVVGLLPLALLGFLSFSVNRAELELSASAVLSLSITFLAISAMLMRRFWLSACSRL